MENESVSPELRSSQVFEVSASRQVESRLTTQRLPQAETPKKEAAQGPIIHGMNQHEVSFFTHEARKQALERGETDEWVLWTFIKLFFRNILAFLQQTSDGVQHAQG